MFDPMLDSRVVEQRKQDLLRHARLQHMRRELLGRPRLLHQRWLAMVADLMICRGTQLKQRYAATQAEAPVHADLAVLDMGWDRL